VDARAQFLDKLTQDMMALKLIELKISFINKSNQNFQPSGLGMGFSIFLVRLTGTSKASTIYND
jgi:hypothetical protein